MMQKMKMHKISTQYPQGQCCEMIKKKAEEIYVKSGRKEGRDLENWLEAERIIKARMCSNF